MLVMLIIGLLTITLLPIMVKARYQSQLTACEFNIRGLVGGIESYHTDHKTYPPTGIAEDLLANGYIAREPKCPVSEYKYGYVVNSDDSNFTLFCNGGLHNLVLPQVNAGYPQYNPARGLFLKP
jgi:competence protein ComGC